MGAVFVWGGEGEEGGGGHKRREMTTVATLFLMSGFWA